MYPGIAGTSLSTGSPYHHLPAVDAMMDKSGIPRVAPLLRQTLSHTPFLHSMPVSLALAGYLFQL